jgi:SAM-dependent methyltransferase
MEASPRPFYDEFAWAYDLLMGERVGRRSAIIERALADRGVLPPARVLDAGCGTGDHALALARRGFRVFGFDRSIALVREARRKVGGAAQPMVVVGDLLSFAVRAPMDAVLCRGVLNDILEDAERQAAVDTVGRVLRPGGCVVLDVRDWDASAVRKRREPVTERVVNLPDGTLTFRSETRLDPPSRRLLVRERFWLERRGRMTGSDHDFAIRCWSREDLETKLRGAGLDRLEYLSIPGCTVPGFGDDRIAVSALRG